MLHVKKPACPNCRLLYTGSIVATLEPGDMINCRCQKCKKLYYIYFENTDDYYTFTNYYSFHKLKLSE